jgi:creatinine amidohydrolase
MTELERTAPRESRPWELAELNYAAVKQQQFEVAVLPLGATEPHNLHLPYGTDLFEATIIGRQACQVATARGAKVLLLPTIPFGTETNLREFPLAINLNPSTLGLVIEDVVRSLEKSGIRKVVLLNSHGGNDFKPLLRELYGQTAVHLFLCNWYQMVADACREIFEYQDDHAGEMETSLALAYFGHLVGRNPDGTLAADAGAKRPVQFAAVERGWISMTRPWHLLTTNSGAGYPHAATVDKGQRLMGVIAERLGGFLHELSAAPIGPDFPFATPS